MIEIGSEFWYEDQYEHTTKTLSWLKLGKDNKFLASGRTAIDYVLQDIQTYKEIKNVYFPSYCCQSMIQPFIDNDISIKFYDVTYTDQLEFHIDTLEECDIFFGMNYFGYNDGRMDRYIEAFKTKNAIIIEDSTHSLLSKPSYNNHSDYIIASLRKWFPIYSGGLAIKTQGEFSLETKKESLNDMIKLKKEAMVEKANYIHGDQTIIKSDFLQKYSDSNKMMANNYSKYDIDQESLKILQSIDHGSVIEARRANAIALHDNLKNVHDITAMFPTLHEGDCPLFVPFVMDSKLRGNLRKHLIDNSVYYPNHWPKPDGISDHHKLSNVSNYELSFVCDQRYSVDDMKYSTQLIKDYLE